MKISIMDYNSCREEITIPDNTAKIVIEVISGDEVAHVMTDDGSTFIFPHSTRAKCNHDFFDGCYTIYDKAAIIDRINQWNLRCDPYEFPDSLY